MPVADPLNALAMWGTWQETVRAALPLFAASPHYVEQDGLSPDEVDDVVGGLPRGVPYDPDGMVRDVVHGARAFPTRRGPVTRQWVDGNIEIDFLRRVLGDEFPFLDVLDIGAGYGRLAVMLAPWVRSYTCVDAVPVSVDVCRAYTQQYAPAVRVLDVAGLREAMAQQTIRPTLAINIHSWNECALEQIVGWLDVLDVLRVPRLFTVSHGQNHGACPTGRTASGHPAERSYRAWDQGVDESFKPQLGERYWLVREETLGLSSHPHALWARRPK